MLLGLVQPMLTPSIEPNSLQKILASWQMTLKFFHSNFLNSKYLLRTCVSGTMLSILFASRGVF